MQDRGGARSYYHVDGLGSTRALTNQDGLVTDRYTYDAFGTILTRHGTTANLYLFAGERLDQGLGQYDLRARLYDPGTGRFESRDTSGVLTSGMRPLGDYLYGGADPVNNIDPSGHCIIASNRRYGNIVHKKIGEHFVELDPDHNVANQWISTILDLELGIYTIISNRLNLRPDLVERYEDRGYAYEIKPAGSWLEGKAQLTGYLKMLNAWDYRHRVWKYGTQYEPEHYIPVTDLVFAIVDDPVLGVIIYQVCDLKQIIHEAMVYMLYTALEAWYANAMLLADLGSPL
jgi:RHS repeat-associated protein